MKKYVIFLVLFIAAFCVKAQPITPQVNENVELALQICRNPLDAREVMEEVGLGDRLNNFPAQLSGGEQQRVSIARAISKYWHSL